MFPGVPPWMNPQSRHKRPMGPGAMFPQPFLPGRPAVPWWLGGGSRGFRPGPFEGMMPPLPRIMRRGPRRARLNRPFDENLPDFRQPFDYGPPERRRAQFWPDGVDGVDDLEMLNRRFGGMGADRPPWERELPRDSGFGRLPREREVPRTMRPRQDLFDNPFDIPRHSRSQARRCGVPGYRLVRRLEPGGMSEAVNLVQDQRSGKLFVEKRFRADGFHASRAAAELRALQRVRSPNLNYMVTHLRGPRDAYCTFVLEYCDAGSLEDAIKHYRESRHNVPEKFVWHALAGISYGLAFLHHGIRDAARDPRPIGDWNTTCHLDLQPCNVFLSTTNQEGHYPRIVVGDFGCAIMQSDIILGMEHPRQPMFRTPDWYPPEGLAHVVGPSRTRYGPATDVWQLAVSNDYQWYFTVFADI